MPKKGGPALGPFEGLDGSRQRRSKPLPRSDNYDLLDIPDFLTLVIKEPRLPVAPFTRPFIMPKTVFKPKRHRLPADMKAALAKLGWTAYYRVGMTFERALTIIRAQSLPERKRRKHVVRPT